MSDAQPPLRETPQGAEIFLSRLAEIEKRQAQEPGLTPAVIHQRADLFDSVFVVIALYARTDDEPDLDAKLVSACSRYAGAVFTALFADSPETEATVTYQRIWDEEHLRYVHGFYFRLPDPTKLVRESVSNFNEVLNGLNYFVKNFQVALGPDAPGVRWAFHLCETDDLDPPGFREYYIGRAKDGDGAALRKVVAADWWFASAPPSVDIASQCEALAACYHAGRGVPQEPTEEAYWHQNAARLGNRFGQTKLGVMCVEGRGVARDASLAASLFHQAAEQGEYLAQIWLCILNYRGVGVPQDFEKAAGWCRKAADQGNMVAEYTMGLLYSRGHGVPRDADEADHWFARARLKGLTSSTHVHLHIDSVILE